MVHRIFTGQTDRQTGIFHTYRLWSPDEDDVSGVARQLVCCVYCLSSPGASFLWCEALRSPLLCSTSAFMRCFYLTHLHKVLTDDDDKLIFTCHCSALLSLCLIVALGFLSNKADTDDMRHDNSWDLTEAVWSNKEKTLNWPSSLKSLSSWSFFRLAWFQMKWLSFSRCYAADGSVLISVTRVVSTLTCQSVCSGEEGRVYAQRLPRLLNIQQVKSSKPNPRINVWCSRLCVAVLRLFRLNFSVSLPPQHCAHTLCFRLNNYFVRSLWERLETSTSVIKIIQPLPNVKGG